MDDEVEVPLEEFLAMLGEQQEEAPDREFEVSEPSDNEDINKVAPFQWVRLPTGEPGILVHYLDVERQPVDKPEVAYSVLAFDRYERLHHWEINEETVFGEIVLQ